MPSRSPVIWTFAVTSVALVMVMLDNLVVSTAQGYWPAEAELVLAGAVEP